MAEASSLPPATEEPVQQSPESTRRHKKSSSKSKNSRSKSTSKSSNKSSSKSSKKHSSSLKKSIAECTEASAVTIVSPPTADETSGENEGQDGRRAKPRRQSSRSSRTGSVSGTATDEKQRRRRTKKRTCCTKENRCPRHAVFTFQEECTGDIDFSDDCQSTDFLGDSLFDDEILDDAREYTCLTEAQLLEEQTKEVQSLSELLAITPVAAAALLRKFQWKKENLLTAYFENTEKVFREAGIKRENLVPRPSVPIRIPSESQSQAASNSCSLCFEDDLEPDQVFSLSCGDTFCTVCWQHYLSIKITEGQTADITCPAMKCDLLVDESSVRLLVAPEVFERYRRFTINAFVDTNEYVKWCPAPGCGNAVNIDSVKNQTVTCSCGHRFCFACGEPAHRPATCEQWKNWKAKSNDESETGNWLAANTQPCPKCGSHTEKNGGCNHMVCRIPTCGYEYCWKCTKEWKGHSNFYACSRFERDQKKLAKRQKKGKNKPSKYDRLQAQEEHRRLLERYLRHFDKFIEYDRGDNTELRETSQRKAQQWQALYGVAADVGFIERATETLIEARRALKYSYVTAFYLEDSDTKRSLFEFIQSDLEKSVSNLIEVLEAQTIPKQQALDATRIAETRLRTIIESSEPFQV